MIFEEYPGHPMAVVTVGRWGNNLAIRIPGDVARAAGIQDGERVSIETVEGGVVIRRATAPGSLEELFAARSPAEWRAEYASAYDWGPDVGREIVEE
jgi:antitoxin component of MazEF toxin-antitoxin module